MSAVRPESVVARLVEVMRLVFDPTNRTDGIDLSADPVLAARSAAYAISYERRSRGE